jgi:putative hydrolase of HD superfamily
MDCRKFVEFLNVIEKLKCNTRHSWTSSGRQESVAEHSWRLAVMAMLCADEYPDVDINKVIKMCLIHDFGEAITGDIPAFCKSQEDELDEDAAIKELLALLPYEAADELSILFSEMKEQRTDEAKLYKALDNLEALISHNEADISTWIPLEYEENLTYGQKNSEWSAWTKELRELVKQDSIDKIKNSNN